MCDVVMKEDKKYSVLHRTCNVYIALNVQEFKLSTIIQLNHIIIFYTIYKGKSNQEVTENVDDTSRGHNSTVI
jgi:hypothetical protein